LQGISASDRARDVESDEASPRVQQELLELSRALVEARREADALRTECASAVAERQELIAIVCHELRTPITVIQGYGRLLLSEKVGELNDEQRHFVEQSSKSCGRIDEFVELLLRASRAERAATDVEPVEASLAPVLTGVLEYLRPVLEECNARVSLQLDPSAVQARFDAARLEQVVVNLVTNGLEYGGAGGALRIHTRPVLCDGIAMVEIGVADDGPGVPEGERERIFEPHIRGAAAGSSRGLGLGLAICRRIVEAHGGSIAVRPERAGGSCVVFTLPAAEPKDDPIDEGQERHD